MIICIDINLYVLFDCRQFTPVKKKKRKKTVVQADSSTTKVEPWSLFGLGSPFMLQARADAVTDLLVFHASHCRKIL